MTASLSWACDVSRISGVALMPQRLFQWLRPENRRPFYVIVALLVFGCMTILALSLGAFPLSEKEQTAVIRVIVCGVGFLTLLYVIVRGEQINAYQHKATHDLRDGQQAAVLIAEHTRRVAEATAKEIPEKTAELTVKKINGGLERAAQKALNESPLPSTREEWEAFVKSLHPDCEQMIDRALDRAIQRGWKPPETPRVQT